jgi:hypothetical protein
LIDCANEAAPARRFSAIARKIWKRNPRQTLDHGGLRAENA